MNEILQPPAEIRWCPVPGCRVGNDNWHGFCNGHWFDLPDMVTSPAYRQRRLKREGQENTLDETLASIVRLARENLSGDYSWLYGETKQ